MRTDQEVMTHVTIPVSEAAKPKRVEIGRGTATNGQPQITANVA